MKIKYFIPVVLCILCLSSCGTTSYLESESDAVKTESISSVSEEQKESAQIFVQIEEPAEKTRD